MAASAAAAVAAANGSGVAGKRGVEAPKAIGEGLNGTGDTCGDTVLASTAPQVCV